MYNYYADISSLWADLRVFESTSGNLEAKYSILV